MNTLFHFIAGRLLGLGMWLGLCCSTLVSGQVLPSVSGRVLEAATGEAIPFATVYNPATRQGILCNEAGYFRLDGARPGDSIQVSCVGYVSQVLRLESGDSFITVVLVEASYALKEVMVRAPDKNFLYDELAACNKANRGKGTPAKAYYEVKSYQQGRQVELVEGFYNVHLAGYDVTGMQLKAARVGLRPYENNLFASLESSKAISGLRLLGRNPHFPESPFGLPRQACRRYFYLDLDRRYQAADGDSIYVIIFTPKDTTGRFFEGKVWVNKTRNQILKTVQYCRHSRLSAFRPLFSADSILEVSYAITRTFVPHGRGMRMRHVDIACELLYASRIGSADERVYPVRTRAVLFAFDPGDQFLAPHFEVPAGIEDYRLINAMPHNAFFWRTQSGRRLYDPDGANDRFLADTATLTAEDLFASGPVFSKGMLQHPYMTWSRERIDFREASVDSLASDSVGAGQLNPYQLTARLFLDVNRSGDSTDILTATVIDPFESYWHLPHTPASRAFINLYFDLAEIARQDLDVKLRSSAGPPEDLHALFARGERDWQARARRFIRETKDGTNPAAMQEWNDVVRQRLGIDNMALFGAFTPLPED